MQSTSSSESRSTRSWPVVDSSITNSTIERADCVGSGTGVDVGGTGVDVGGTSVGAGGSGVEVGGTGVEVAGGAAVGVGVGSSPQAATSATSARATTIALSLGRFSRNVLRRAIVSTSLCKRLVGDVTTTYLAMQCTALCCAVLRRLLVPERLGRGRVARLSSRQHRRQ